MGMTFQEVLAEHNVEVAPSDHEHSRDGWVNFDCPFCSPGWHHYRMGYNVSFGYCNCWACGSHRTGDVLVELTGLPIARCLQIFKEVAREPAKAKDVRPRGRLELPTGLGPLLRPHRQYLKGRGFDPDELVKLWKIQGIGIHADLAWRIFMPVVYHGETISYTTRSLQDTGRRYQSANKEHEAISAREVLYGADYARHGIVIHEGPTDVWRVGPGACATLGLGYSRAQLACISDYPVRAVCFDNEPAAQQRAQKLCHELKSLAGQTYNVVLSGKDAASSPKREIRELRKRFLE